MPTENRSSNTEMVSVPRGLLQCAAREPSGEVINVSRRHALESLRDLLAQPAPQPHPEPIAWMVGTAFWWTKEEAERDAAATGLPIVGVGPITGIEPAEQRQGEAFADAAPGTQPDRAELTRMVDAAMVEMSNIHPPLGRGDCARLIRAALERRP